MWKLNLDTPLGLFSMMALGGINFFACAWLGCANFNAHRSRLQGDAALISQSQRQLRLAHRIAGPLMLFSGVLLWTLLE